MSKDLGLRTVKLRLSEITVLRRIKDERRGQTPRICMKLQLGSMSVAVSNGHVCTMRWRSFKEIVLAGDFSEKIYLRR